MIPVEIFIINRIEDELFDMRTGNIPFNKKKYDELEGRLYKAKCEFGEKYIYISAKKREIPIFDKNGNLKPQTIEDGFIDFRRPYWDTVIKEWATETGFRFKTIEKQLVW